MAPVRFDSRKNFFVLMALYFSLLLVVFLTKNLRTQKTQPLSGTVKTTPQITPVPTVFQSFVQPKIPVKNVYRIALLGDSMTAAIGPHGGRLSEYLNSVYKDRAGAGIIIDNYAVPSTNIQTLQKRFNEPLEIDKTMYPPLRDRQDLDLIILESFGYNPLSHLSETDSELEHHRQVRLFLQNVASSLPRTRVILMSTIAPNKRTYALKVQNISQNDRMTEAAERSRYLVRHMEIAGMYGLPVIDVFDKSLTRDGDGDLKYIDKFDYIHPSAEGIELIARTTTDFIFDQRILPAASVPY